MVGGGATCECVDDGVCGIGETTGAAAGGGGWYGDETIGECWGGRP